MRTRALEWAERHGRLRRRATRVRRGLFPSAQAAAAAAISWWAAHWLLRTPHPVFAPIVATAALGFTTGRRGRAAVQTVVGVALGIAIADAVAWIAGGRGGMTVAVVIFVAMATGLFIGDSSAFVTQAAVTALIVTATFSGAPTAPLLPGRLAQALIGGTTAILFSQVLFPVDAVARTRGATRQLIEVIARTMEAAARDPEQVETLVPALVAATHQLGEAVDVATSAARLSARRGTAGAVTPYRRAREHLADAASAAVSLARIAARDPRAILVLRPEFVDAAHLARSVDRGEAVALRPPTDARKAESLSTAAARKALGIVAEELSEASAELAGRGFTAQGGG